MPRIAQMFSRKSRYQIDPETATLRSFVMFIGFGRSGHSIVGQIINAHPNALVADEGSIFDELGDSPSLERVTNYLISRDIHFAKRRYQKGKKRDFHFPGLYQGYVSVPSVFGNSKAGYTSRAIAESPELPERFGSAVGLPLKFVAIIRNPFDMIASGMRRRNESFEHTYGNFAEMSRLFDESLKILKDYPVLLVRQEDFLGSSDEQTDRLFNFLELPTSTEFKRIIASKLFTAPDKSRHRVPEVAENRARVDELIASYEFFSGYSYES